MNIEDVREKKLKEFTQVMNDRIDAHVDSICEDSDTPEVKEMVKAMILLNIGNLFWR